MLDPGNFKIKSTISGRFSEQNGSGDDQSKNNQIKKKYFHPEFFFLNKINEAHYQ